jgi:hypothetical protein
MTDELRDRTWLLVGLFGNDEGELAVRSGRLTLRTQGGVSFDVPLAEVGSVEFPWYTFGAGVQFTVAGRRYRLSFVLPTAYGGRIGDVPEGRHIGAAWQTAFREAGLLGRPR